MIDLELETTLINARVNALQQRHKFITVEHLLLALLDNPSAVKVIGACGGNIDTMRKSLISNIRNTPLLDGTCEIGARPTLGFQRVIQCAIIYVQCFGLGYRQVSGAHLLMAIFGGENSPAINLLNNGGATRQDVIDYIFHGIKKGEPPDVAQPSEGDT